MQTILKMKVERNANPVDGRCQFCTYYRVPAFRITLPHETMNLCIVCVRSLRSLIGEDNLRRAMEGSLAAEPLDK